MDIIKIDQDVPDEKIINHAVKVLKQGGVVMYPTDTAYGLAADIENRQGIEKIFKIKGRMKYQTLPLIAGSLLMANKYVAWTLTGKKLAQKYWPGPLTIILKSRIMDLESRIFHKHIIKQDKIAIRMPDSKIAQMISQKSGRPITSTSANISGEMECYLVADFLNQVIGQKFLPDLILDAGRLKKIRPSTVADTSGEKIVLVREGVIKI